jgi:N utilization substance protein A
MQFDLKHIVDSISKEKNIDNDVLLSSLQEAVVSAAKKFYGEGDIEAKYNEETQEIELWRYLTVVENTAKVDPTKQILYTEALKMDASVQIGDEVGENLPMEPIGRIATHTAKHTISIKMMEAERERIITDFKDKKHQLVVGQVRRFDRSDMVVDLGSCDGIIPYREQIPGEKFKIRDKITAVVIDVKKATRGPNIILSRISPEMLIRLFEQEVSEITDGIVTVHGAARDPGSRSKISVESNEPSIDPVGACVGLKGARVQAIVQELKGEKIDIILYDKDAAKFVCNALAPAEVSKVVVNERMHSMEVIVPDEFLSLAIGKKGQNVRLAAQLTGWKVDIRSESKMRELMEEHRKIIAKIPALGEIRSEILVNEGYRDPLDIAQMDPKSLARILRLSDEESIQIIDGAKELAESIENENIQKSKNINEIDLAKILSQEINSSSDQAGVKDLFPSNQKVPSLMNPDSVDPSSVSDEQKSIWLKVKGIGEITATNLIIAGYLDFTSITQETTKEACHKTGLPNHYIQRIKEEILKTV